MAPNFHQGAAHLQMWRNLTTLILCASWVFVPFFGYMNNGKLAKLDFG